MFGRKKAENPPQAEQQVQAFAVMPEDLRLVIARLKGRAPAEVVRTSLAEAFPLTAAIAADRKRAEEFERQRAEAEAKAAKELKIGRLVPGKGIFAGTWEPKDRDGKSLGKVFNLFAAPEDVNERNADGSKVLLTYNDTVKRVAGLKGWNGHDGANLSNDTELYKALKNGTYNGGWFIPTKDIVHGKDIDGNEIRKDHNLYALRETGDFMKDGKSTFTTVSGSDGARWYWSCSEPRDVSSGVFGVVFTVGDDAWGHKDNNRLSSRPVRAELRP